MPIGKRAGNGLAQPMSVTHKNDENMTKTFVGIGLGAIQSGLFLLEAQLSGNFDRFVVAEVAPERVAGIRAAGGKCWINVALRDQIRQEQISDLEIYNPIDLNDAARLVKAISEASEIATALPSVDYYGRGVPSPAQLLAQGIARKLTDHDAPHAVVYAAENHNHAAKLLRERVLAELDAANQASLGGRVQFVDTVIGKMSGVVTCTLQIQSDWLVPFFPESPRAVLVEAFNRIFIEHITLGDFQRGITIFEERAELAPFEEAKLYGHNAAHALLGFLAQRQRLEFVHEATSEVLSFVRDAFLHESGAALCSRHSTVDPLFTPSGWSAYVDDLMIRMTNIHLRDRVDRIIRDPRRKLGWDDRFVGTMKMAIRSNIEPNRFSLGAAMAVELVMANEQIASVEDCLLTCWGNTIDFDESRQIINRIRSAITRLYLDAMP